MATNNLYDTSNPLLNSALINNLLGTDTERDTKSNQNTVGNQNVATVGQQNVNTTGQNNTNVTGQQNVNTQSQQTAVSDTATQGRTSTTGTSSTATRGQNVTNTSRETSNTEQTSADTAGLRQILAQQMQGITPEMLAAIFSEGSKQAPQLMTATSNALGARATQNTPLANVLAMLQGQLTAKAADVNTQMLRDAGNTAGQIANYTKSVTTSGNDKSTQVQDINQTSTTSSTQDQVMQQLVHGVTGTSTNSVTGTTTNQQTAGTTNQQSGTSTNQTSNTRSDQNVTAAEKVNTQQTINRNIAQGVVGAFAAGATIDQLFRQATGQGFVGNLKQFASWLAGVGGDATKIQTQMKDFGVDWTADAGTFNADGTYTPSVGGITMGGNSTLTDTAADVTTDPTLDSAHDFMGSGDIGAYIDGIDVAQLEWEFADGGSLTEVTPLIKKQDEAPLPDATQPLDITSFLGSVLNTGLSQGIAQRGQVDPGNTAVAVTPAAGTSPAQLSQAEMDGAQDDSQLVQNTGDAEGQQRAATDPSKDWKVGQVTRMGQTQTTYQGQDSQTTYDNPATGYQKFAGITGDREHSAYDVFDASGKFMHRQEVAFGDPWGDALMALAAAIVPGGGMVMAAGAMDQASDRGDVGGMLSAAASAYASGAGLAGSEYAGVAQNVATGVNVANKAYNAQGKADGGQIHGPGTGISDDVPARGANGEKIQLSNKEYIIPEDVVETLGVNFFDKLLEQFHTPAALQRAMGIQ